VITLGNTAFRVGLSAQAISPTHRQHTVLTTERYPFLQQDSYPYPSKWMAADPCFRHHGHWNQFKTK